MCGFCRLRTAQSVDGVSMRRRARGESQADFEQATFKTSKPLTRKLRRCAQPRDYRVNFTGCGVRKSKDGLPKVAGLADNGHPARQNAQVCSLCLGKKCPRNLFPTYGSGGSPEPVESAQHVDFVNVPLVDFGIFRPFSTNVIVDAVRESGIVDT